jgi:hypothetical protein
MAYPALATAERVRRRTPPPAITEDRFALTPSIDASTLVLFAVARRPKRQAQPGP